MAVQGATLLHFAKANKDYDIDALAQDCSNSIVNVLALL